MQTISMLATIRASMSAVLLMAPLGAAMPALASATPPVVQSPSVRIPAAAAQPRQAIAEAAARQIAWRSGIDHIEEALLWGDRWEIAGRDREGNEIALDIHAYDGRVLR